MISLDKCNWSYNVVDDLFTKICVPTETKDVNLAAVNIITKINKVKTLIKHISFNCKCKFDSTTCNWNHK